MAYRLIFTDTPTGEIKKDVGDNVFLDDLPADYKVYLFYYPDAMGNETLENQLTRFGDMTGKNLFVNLGKLNDPNYNKIADYFEIRSLPAIVMTAVADLASSPTDSLSSYVRIDSKRLLGSTDHLFEALQKIFNLFIQGDIARGLKEAKKADRSVLIKTITKVITDGLKGLWDFIKDTDITVSVAEGKLELKHH